MKKIAILGSTGSVGQTALTLIKKHPEHYQVVSLAAGEQVDVLAEQIRTFKPRWVSVKSEAGVKKLRELTGNIRGIEYGFGVEAAETAASLPEADFVLSSIVGASGLRPTLAAAKAGKTIGLANKESLVVAGALVTKIVKEHGATLLPVDSEHSAIFQCLLGSSPEHVEKLILTASGGPFFSKPELDLESVSKEAALKHPNWSMGAKITIDSATMMNKGLEAIEACWLFGLPSEKIEVVVHPQSIIHSMVEFVDRSVLAQLSLPDMTGPISFALSYPSRIREAMEPLRLSKLRELTFFEPDHRRFPAVRLALDAFASGPTFPAVLNGANEVTVDAFLNERIAFTDITRINAEVVSKHVSSVANTLHDFIEADQWGRSEAERLVRTKEK